MKLCKLGVIITLLINVTAFSQNISFVQKLHDLTNFNTRYVDFCFFNIDTVNTTVDVNISFYFSKKALKYIANQIQNDTLLDNSNENNEIKPNKKVSFSLQGLNFTNIENGLIANQKCNIISILGEDINKKVKCILLLEKKDLKSFNLYIELHQDHWYYFKFIHGVMYSYSSKVDHNNIIYNTQPRKRRKKHKNDIYSYYCMSKRQADTFLYKVVNID